MTQTHPIPTETADRGTAAVRPPDRLVVLRHQTGPLPSGVAQTHGMLPEKHAFQIMADFAGGSSLLDRSEEAVIDRAQVRS